MNWVGEDILPLPIMQDGMFTHESRGIDITSAHCLSAGMCTSIIVSDLSVLSTASPGVPSRESESTTRMFSACGCRSGDWVPDRGGRSPAGCCC